MLLWLAARSNKRIKLTARRARVKRGRQAAAYPQSVKRTLRCAVRPLNGRELREKSAAWLALARVRLTSR